MGDKGLGRADGVRAGRVVGFALLTSGIGHCVVPRLFEPLIPEVLGKPRGWVIGSGIAEIVSGAGLLAGHRWAPPLASATLAVIWVGNVQMALDASRPGTSPVMRAVAWGRLPLQVPMIRAAWRSPVKARG